MAEPGEISDDSEDEIPKLPRAPLFGKPSLHGVVRLGMFATLLYAIIVMRRPCADGVGRFITGFDDAPDAAPAQSSDHYPGYELMTAEEALKRWPDSPARDGGAAQAAGSDAGEQGKAPDSTSTETSGDDAKPAAQGTEARSAETGSKSGEDAKNPAKPE